MFITFEGPDMSGKTTQVTLLNNFLVKEGYSVKVVREPGSTSIGDQIRAILHDSKNEEIVDNTEVLLYQAARAQLVGEVISPALREGRIVLADRYADSTLAYQGGGRGLDINLLRYLNNFATGGLTPDLTFLLDMEPTEARLRRGRELWNRMDAQEIKFYQRARESYLVLAHQEPRWRVVDASQAIEEVFEEIRRETMLKISEVGVEPRREVRPPGMERFG